IKTVGAAGFQENFRRALVAGPGGLERHEIDFAKSPIQGKEAVAEASRKLKMPITSDPGWRTAANRVENIHRVGVVIRTGPTPPPTFQPPAVMPRITDMIQTSGRIPGEKEIALHVAIVGKEVPQPVEIKIIRIAEALG